jgi:hypothetical protein
MLIVSDKEFKRIMVELNSVMEMIDNTKEWMGSLSRDESCKKK